MSRRLKHRVADQAAREARAESGLPVNPTASGKRKPRQTYPCKVCPSVFRHPWQWRIHMGLGRHVATAVPAGKS